MALPTTAPSFFPSDLSCRLPSSLSLSSKAAAAVVVMIILPPPSPPVLVSKLSSVRVRHVGSKSRKKPPTNEDVLRLEAAASNATPHDFNGSQIVKGPQNVVGRNPYGASLAFLLFCPSFSSPPTLIFKRACCSPSSSAHVILPKRFFPSPITICH